MSSRLSGSGGIGSMSKDCLAAHVAYGRVKIQSLPRMSTHKHAVKRVWKRVDNIDCCELAD